MPSLRIQTNLALDASEREDLLRRCSELISRELGKDEKYFMGRIDDSCAMHFAGSRDPLALCELQALGLTAEHSPSLTAGLCDLLLEHLALPPERVYVTFHPVERGLWGWNRTVF